jgi:hypothetical protein
MAGTATWQITGTSDDGTQVIINVTATLNDDGSITVEYGLADGSADADIIGVYFDFFNDGGDLDTAGNGRGGSANNMKGYGDGFDAAFEEGKAGLEDGANTEGTITFTAEQLKAFGFVDDEGKVLEGAALMEAFAETEIGIRATSTGEDGEGSLKIGAVGEYHPPEDEDEFTDHFPDLEKDISYVNFVFKLNDNAEDDAKALDTNGDGYVTVKIEIPEDYDPTNCTNNLDTWYQDALAAIYEEYPELVGNTTEEGAFIKGGINLFEEGDNVWSHGAPNSIAYFSYDDDPGNDPLPEGYKTDENGNIVATGNDKYDDGHTVDFDPAWVPEECVA